MHIVRPSGSVAVMTVVVPDKPVGRTLGHCCAACMLCKLPDVCLYRCLSVAPPGAGEYVQKLCNMCVLSLSWNFFVSHDKFIARPSSKEPR